MAEDLGKNLLAQIEEVGFDEVFIGGDTFQDLDTSRLTLAGTTHVTSTK